MPTNPVKSMVVAVCSEDELMSQFLTEKDKIKLFSQIVLTLLELFGNLCSIKRKEVAL